MTSDVEIRDVTKVYPDGTTGVKGVSLDVKRGEFFSLLGPSGCGKSTLLKLLAGIEEPTRGSVVVRDRPVKVGDMRKSLTNLVFQRLALFPQMTVRQNVAFGPKMHKKTGTETKAIVDAQLELVNLTDYAHKYPHELSGGQQQRVAIARSLANEPAVLLLDEPLNSLDLKLRIQMQQVLKDIQRSAGTTFIYVTHDQSEAFAMSDSMAVMHDGAIVQSGNPVDLYRRPKTDFVADFVGDTNLFAGRGENSTPTLGGVTVTRSQVATCVAVRPEDVQVFESGQPRDIHQFVGTIKELTFRGPTLRCRIQASDGQSVISDQPARAATGYAVGDQIAFGWADEAVVVIR